MPGAERHCVEFIDFDEADRWRDFSGVRRGELPHNADGRGGWPRKPQTVEEMKRWRNGMK